MRSKLLRKRRSTRLSHYVDFIHRRRDWVDYSEPGNFETTHRAKSRLRDKGRETINPATSFGLGENFMCGIAGIIDLAGQRSVPEGTVQRMARALVHRGPDEEGFFVRPGVGFASRRLSIVGLADGQQPVTNEDRSVFVVFNGELFDYVERRADLK